MSKPYVLSLNGIVCYPESRQELIEKAESFIEFRRTSEGPVYNSDYYYVLIAEHMAIITSNDYVLLEPFERSINWQILSKVQVTFLLYRFELYETAVKELPALNQKYWTLMLNSLVG